jgi:hypothetical protein
VADDQWRPKKGTIWVTKGADYFRRYRWDGSTFTTGTRLFYIIDGKDYDYVISDDRTIASITIESEVTDTFMNKTPYRLMLKIPNGDKTRDICLEHGTIQRDEPRNV